MNILLVSSDNSIVSGAFNSLTFLAKELKERGNNVYITVPCKGDGTSLLKDNNLSYSLIYTFEWSCDIGISFSNLYRIILQIKRMAYNNRIAINEYVNFIKENNIEIVHLNTIYTYVAAIAAKRCGVKIVWHIREFMEEDQKKRFIFKKYSKRLIGSADRIICISNSIYNKFSKCFDKNKMEVIHNGIDINKYYIPNRSIFLNKKVEFICVGPINERKGQFELVEGIGRYLQNNNSIVRLRLVGAYTKENYKKIMSLINKYNLNKVVDLCGKSDNPVRYYNESDILCMCSVSEAFGRVTVEGMLAGCLVLGKNCAATSEIVVDGETGILYNDLDDLVTKIKYIIDNKEKMKSIANYARDYAKNNYSSHLNEASIYHTYEALINN